MILKIENSEIDINVKNILKALGLAYVTTKVYKAIVKPKQVVYVVLNDESKTVRMNTKLPKTKVESK